MDSGGLLLILVLILVPVLAGFIKGMQETGGTRRTVPYPEPDSKRPADASPTFDQINSSQVTTCFARVITKRTPGGSEYYIGFEMEDGERIELCVQGSQYGVIIEGDQGMVSFRDGRMVAFDRTGAVPRKA